MLTRQSRQLALLAVAERLALLTGSWLMISLTVRAHFHPETFDDALAACPGPPWLVALYEWAGMGPAMLERPAGWGPPAFLRMQRLHAATGAFELARRAIEVACASLGVTLAAHGMWLMPREVVSRLFSTATRSAALIGLTVLTLRGADALRLASSFPLDLTGLAVLLCAAALVTIPALALLATVCAVPPLVGATDLLLRAASIIATTLYVNRARCPALRAPARGRRWRGRVPMDGFSVERVANAMYVRAARRRRRMAHRSALAATSKHASGVHGGRVLCGGGYAAGAA